MNDFYNEIIEKFGSITAYNMSLMPDWTKKNQRIWTKDEVDALITKEIGKNILWPTTYHVLLKTYLSDEEIDLGNGQKIKSSTEHRDQEMYESRKALVLAWGPDAFTDRGRFPTGPVCNIGDWVVYRRLENSPIRSNRAPLCFVLDDKIMALTDDPKGISTQNLIGR